MSNENKDEVKNEKNVSGVESDYVSPCWFLFILDRQFSAWNSSLCCSLNEPLKTCLWINIHFYVTPLGTNALSRQSRKLMLRNVSNVSYHSDIFEGY